MQVKTTYLKDTEVKIEVKANPAELKSVKDQVLAVLGRQQKSIPGFRGGHAPLNVVEKHVNPELLQTEFLDSAINQLFVKAIQTEKLRPTAQPQVQIDKFVPYDTLDFSITVEVIGKVKLADYKKMKLTKTPVKVTAKEINEVIKSLRTRAADKTEVKRAIKNGDEATIDFSGVDTKTKEPISGADGKGYPLPIGSDTFIPGFEPELIGLKAGESKTFDITFPKDYSVSALQNRKVTFTVDIKKVEELKEPTIDDKFASKVGPFKTLAELKEDIKKQLISEAETKADREFQNTLINMITEKTELSVPASLIEEQLDRADEEEKQNLVYRGQTWQEHLDLEGITDEEHRERNRPAAEQTVKASLVLAEIADAEKIDVSPEEIEIRVQILKGQYQDKEMQAELDKKENRQSILNQILAEKTLNKLTDYATKS